MSATTRGGAEHPRIRGGTDHARIRELARAGSYDEAWGLVRRMLLTDDTASAWSVARNLLRAGERSGWVPACARQIRLAVLCTYESAELAVYLRVACLALGIDPELYVAPFGQVEQELLGPRTGLARFEPTHVLIAPTTADLGFPELADEPDALLSEAEGRWRRVWDLIRTRHQARVVQHGFVVPDESPIGHVSMRLSGSRLSLVRELNRRLGEAAGAETLLVDCERLAARIGKRGWMDPRMWYAARQPFSSEALPVLARESAAVLAADLGLAARCVIVDLDNTLWGGVVGEEGPDGITIGHGPEGEAYSAFQDYLLALRARGMILAVASKNDVEGARLPFQQNPDMRLKLEDFAAFVADYRRKPDQITEIAHKLGLGLDAFVFADDNPAECAEVSAALPMVSVVPLDVPPSEFVRTLASNVRLEVSSLSREDATRQRSYAALAKAAALEAAAPSLEDFWRSLRMQARVRELDAGSLDRAVQLTQKTNQFNLTLRRHSREAIERLLADGAAICITLELEDRFANHGLIGLAFAVPSEEDRETALIDTLLLSCRVIGRSAEVHLLSHLSRLASARGFARMHGVFTPGPRNHLVADLYPALGFAPTGANGNQWDYDLRTRGPIQSLYIADV